MPTEVRVSFEELREFWDDKGGRRFLPLDAQYDPQLQGRELASFIQSRRPYQMALASWLHYARRDNRFGIDPMGFSAAEWTVSVEAAALLFERRHA